MLARYISTAAFIISFVFVQESIAQISIIPEPVSLQQNEGSYSFKNGITIAADASAKKVADWTKEKLAVTALPVSVVAANEKADIILTLNKTANAKLGKEGYQLTASANNGVAISANEPAGLFYGVQTFIQLLPAAIESKSVVKNMTWSVPAVEITDYPRFGWRGLMFDISRHFFNKEQIKQYMNTMVKYKYNLLHLTLSNDEGWRVEIKSLPKLNSVGSWNVKRTGTFGNFIPPTDDEPRDYGGYLTHEDVKELVQYANDRFINILPEIDVPGHSLAAIASYPELTCTPGKYRVRSGEKIIEWPA
ncbi:MAG TPA: family 20 glycosylhydrolase, partial [Chitinophagaceae bacterium]|nr:family 20 glycosylhydrolase [Chitinophagaceae bacterium]